jgi:hypothetical protein
MRGDWSVSSIDRKSAAYGRRGTRSARRLPPVAGRRHERRPVSADGEGQGTRQRETENVEAGDNAGVAVGKAEQPHVVGLALGRVERGQRGGCARRRIGGARHLLRCQRTEGERGRQEQVIEVRIERSQELARRDENVVTEILEWETSP